MLSLTIKEVVQQIKQGRLSAKEVCDKCLARANKIKELNAYVTQTSKLAKDQAGQASSRYENNDARTIDGIPVAVKDNFCTKGIRTSCASRMLENYIPPYNATVVNKLLDNGAVLMGKTNLDEYAMGCGSVDSIFGPVRNPWNYNFSTESLQEPEEISGYHSNQTLHGSRYIHTSARNRSQPRSEEFSGDEDNWFIAGGSSGGSAVAVATHSCFGALGSDTGGSVRNPASYCGVVGLKPTYGLLSRHGLIPLVNSLDVPGILTNCVDDAVTLLNLLAGHDVKDSTTVRDPFTPRELPDDISVQGLTVGIPKEYYSPGLSTEIAEAWRFAADIFENSGARVVEVSLPHTQHSIVTYSVLCACEVASNMARYDGIEFGHRASQGQSTEALYATSRHAGFNDVVAGRIFAGNYFLLRQNYDQYFIKAQKVRRLISDDFKKVFADGIDVLLTPTTLTEAPLYSWFKEQDNRTRTAEQDVFTQPVNLAGIPAVSLPVSLSSNGLPLSLQLIGQNFKDHEMLRTAKWLEQQMNFHRLNLDHLDDLSL